MKIGSAFPSKYLKAADLGENKVPVTIDRVELEDVGSRGKKEVKPVLYFKGKERGLVLNKTNANKITSILGTDDTDGWPGQRIVLYATETDFGGETVDCIRVAALPKGTTKPAPPPPPTPDPEGDPYADNFRADDDDVPF